MIIIKNKNLKASSNSTKIIISMIWLVQQFHKLIVILNSDESPSQISAGFILGFLIGGSPFNYVYSLILFLLLGILKVNFTSGLFAILISSLLTPILDPIYHHIGHYLLVTSTGLEGFWTTLYNMPIFPLTNFNNTIMLGSMVVNLLLSILLFFLIKKLILSYRETIMTKIKNSKLFKLLKASKLVKWYSRIVV